MLEELELRDLGPIHEATIVPAVGMTAITGETGAGKSMLLSALQLITGATADNGRVREGAQAAWAQGVFAVDDDHEALAIARDSGLTVEDGEIFLSRNVPASGRSRAFCCGRSVPRSVLQEVAQPLITIHGQADQLRLASAAKQREFLDQYADDVSQRSAYALAWQDYTNAASHLERLRNQEAQVRQRADYLQDSLAQIDRVHPQVGELDELKEQRDTIEHAAQIIHGAGQAVAALDASALDMETDSDAAGVAQLLSQAIHALETIAIPTIIDEPIAQLTELRAQIADVAFSLGNLLDQDDNEGDLDQINARIHALTELTHRWGPELEDVLAWRDRAALEIQDLDASPEAIADLEEQCKRRYERVRQCGAKLTAARRKAARRLGSVVNAELEQLAMPGAQLTISVIARQPQGKHQAIPFDATGGDDIAFLFTPFPSAQPMPVGRSASGGELSRLMLALELAAAERRCTRVTEEDERGNVAPMTFIFDEIDAGVGGRAAVELGRRLARLAQSAQVIVVTHLAQVASWANTQYVVAKSMDAANTVTTVNEVRGQARVEEIARMLAGSESSTSLDHARELLDQSSLDTVAAA